MEVFQVLDRPAFRSFYAVAGRLLFVESLDLRLGKLIERLFAGWQLTPVSFPDQSADIRIEFACGDLFPEIPRNLNQFEIAEGGQCYTAGADFYLTLGNALIHLQNGNPVTVSLWLEKLPGPNEPLLARATSFAVCAALRRYGLFELHSAGVVHPGSEQGVIIIGPSGSGKSTLALQLVMAGWPYLSDDGLLLSAVDGSVEARGFRNFFAVSKPTALAAEIPGLDHTVQMTSGLKTCFDPDTLIGASRRERAVPGLLLFTNVSPEPETGLKKLTQTETMAHLIRACPWASYDMSIAGANLEVLSKLARQTRAFALLAGKDLMQPGYASDLLSARVFTDCAAYTDRSA